MIFGNDKQLELAEERADQAREAGIASVRLALSQIGADFCVSCGAEIEPERRKALPSARRCVECQTVFEKAKRK
ncbi:molecular chaperone DnaK [Brucella anthropi]|uniref:TraR/DksA C4-type zinc finger protein n=1 Tax=Brucella anthropi TaxID=529 RepID=UPI00044FE877|nr:TraR/DksA C4-type zinc finger protein [Brucella anthropi]EXL08206.1 molecular chaperone DnaK [Brucella anthropi]